ncbi:hypothetical protein DL93DRAFT_2081263 [Clavulina sp. PMI_390]|nr:hypothetical protein DL93DRAFT_2081263 [Clavulina sp. PMI_390]
MTRQSQREIEYLASYGRDAGGSGSGSGSGSKTTEQMTAEQYARFWGPDTTRTTVYDDEDDAAIYRAAFDVQDPVSRAPVIPPRPPLSASNGANNSGGVGGGWNVGSPGNDDDSEVQKGVIASLESSNQQYIEASRRLNNAANSSTTGFPSNAAGPSSSPSKSNALFNSNKGNNAGVTVGQGSARSYASAAVSKLTKSHSKPSSSSSPNNNNNNNAGPSRPSASSATVAGSNAVVVRNSKPSGSKPSVSGSGGKGTGVAGGSGAVPPSMMMGLDADEHLQDQPSFPPLTAPDSPTAGLTSAEARLLQKQEAEDRKSRELAMKLHRQEEQLAERERRQATRRANMNTEYAYDDPAVRDDGSFGGAGIAIPGWNTVSSAVSGAAGMVSNVIGIGGGGSSTRKSGEGSGSGSGGASGSGSAGGSGSGSGGGNRYSVLADSHQNSDGTWTHTRREGNRTIVTTYKMVENHPFASGGRRAQEDEAASLAYATMLQEQENERMMREALEKSRRDSNRVNQYQ